MPDDTKKKRRPELRLGRALRELHRDDVAHIERTYIEAIAAAKEHGSAATITLKVKVRPTQAGETEVSADCTSTLPRRKPRAVTFFFTEDGQDVTRDDPNQSEMDLGDNDEQAAAPALPPTNVSQMPGTKVA